MRHSLRPLLALSLVVSACGDDDGTMTDDALVDLDMGDDRVDGGPVDGGAADAAMAEDGGGEDPWPTTPTDLPGPPEPVLANPGDVQVVETSGGDAVALFRALTAGEQTYVAAYDADTTAWESPRLVPGREAHIASSGASAMLVYTDCEGSRCGNPGADLFAERYTEADGWGAVMQVDDLDPGSPYASMVDTRISYPFVVGDGAGGFLVAWNIQGSTLSLFREYTDDAWQTELGRSGGVTQPGYFFIGHAPRRYVGLHNQDAGKTESIVDGVLTEGTPPSGALGDTVGAINGDRAIFATHRGVLMEAEWTGAAYTWSEVPTPDARQQDQVMLASDGTHEIWPHWVGTSASVGYRLYTQAFVRHDTSGDGSGTYGWTEITVRDESASDTHTVPCGVLPLDEGALVLLWEGDATIRDDQPWSLLAVRIGFDANDAIVVSEPTTLATVTSVEREAREIPVAAVRDGSAIRIAWLDPGLGLRQVAATDAPAMAGAGIDADAATSAVADGRFGSAPSVVDLDGARLAFGDFSTTEAEVALVDGAGGRFTALESTVPAEWRRSAGRPEAVGSDVRVLWQQAFLDSRIVTGLRVDGSTWTTELVAPATFDGRGQVVAVDADDVAFATFRDAGGSTLPESIRLSHRAADGTLTERDVMGTGDWIRDFQIQAFGGGFVATWLERVGTDGTVRWSAYSGGAWSAPATLATNALSQLESGRSPLGSSAGEDAVVVYWYGADDLQASVLTDLGTGFGAPTAMRSTTTDAVARMESASGAAGIALVWREENGSAETTYAARVFAGGSWGDVTTPFESLTDGPDFYALTATEAGFALGYADGSGVWVAQWDGSSWTAESPLMSDGFDAYSVALLSSAAGLRVLAVDETAGTLDHALFDGSWGSAGSESLGGRNVDLEENGEAAAINDAGEVALLSRGDEGDASLELWVLGDSLVRHELGDGYGGVPGVAPNDRFLVLFQREDAGTVSLRARAGF